MKLLKTIKLNCECFDDLAAKQGLTINSRQDNSDKSTYDITTKDGRNLMVIETSMPYAPDAYVTTVEVYEK